MWALYYSSMNLIRLKKDLDIYALGALATFRH